MLILNEKDIYSNINPDDIIIAVEKAYQIQSAGNFIMPNRLHLQSNENTNLVMPCIADGLNVTKLVSVNPGNKDNGLPIIQGTIQLSNQENGNILGLLNGSAVTAIRTGAVGAVALKHLTSESKKSIGIIGTGVQGWHLAWMALTVRPEATILVYDYKKEKTEWFISNLKSVKSGAQIRITSSILEFVQNSEIIITATTSPTPVLPEDKALLKNRTYIGIGSFRPIMGELPRKLYPLISKLYVDVDYAKEESGDVKYPLDKGILNENQIIPFHEVINGTNIPDENTIVFKSVGMALFDLTVTKAIYKTAKLKNTGTKIDL